MVPLFGREGVLARVRELLGDGARAVVLTGPAGVGKSRLLREIAAEVPDARVVDDLHRLSARRLAELVRPAEGVLLAAARDEPAPHLLAALDAWAPFVVPLPGLDVAAVAALAEALRGGPLPVRAAVDLHRRSGGRPYWVELLLRGELPPLVADSLVERVSAAGPDARTCAEAVAVLGTPADPDIVAAVLGVEPDALVPTLRTLLDRRILGQGTGGLVAFDQEVMREALVARVPERQRLRWRAAALEAAHAAGVDDATLARYGAGPEVALRAAAARLHAGAGTEALALAELALPAWQAHEIAARGAHLAGYLDDAEAHARRWRAGTAEPAAAHCLIASLRWSHGDLAGQWAALDAALDAVDDAHPARVTVLAARANALMRAERFAEAVAAADETIALAERVGAAAERRSALVDKGTALCFLGDRGPGLALLRAAARECERAGDRLTLGRALNNALEPSLHGRTDAERWAGYERTWRRATRLRLSNALGKLARQAAVLARTTGRWAPGWAAVTGRLPEESDRAERVTLAAVGGVLALDAGRIDDAARLAERCAAEAPGLDQFWVRAHVALLDVGLTAHRLPPAATVRALARYRRALSPADHARRPHRALAAATYALDHGVAPGTVRAFLTATLPAGLPAELADAAALLFGDGTVEETEAAAERWLSRVDGAVARADACVRLGRNRLRHGRAGAALDCADEAIGLLAEWPGPLLCAARRLRAATGADTPRLTERERAVHALVVTGLSNVDIAGRLGVSPRTVAVHVSRLLAKTGCASRTQLAARAHAHP
ncbi:hypothetical protein Val02_04900 [Virgisporangium aliadipatigenens]|uniref:HTH luxR-type domain-containing protein n=1 Tax=Virgisporangium aliadipatigenens TaxID=741659 RepID=A0A8J3YEE0_9ACTN|nr:LuxR family transcriptional regulator [Virgisporangium aliadipatigenens]GIJ43604.1 hypothetical protein Val02_04900 [Virgisporangium aliadipatigenens]